MVIKVHSPARGRDDECKQQLQTGALPQTAKVGNREFALLAGAVRQPQDHEQRDHVDRHH